MRIRRRRPHGQTVFFFVVRGEIGARLDRASGDPVAANSFFDDHLGVLKDFVDAVRGEMVFVDDIASGVFMNRLRARLHRRFRIDDHRQQIVIHRDHLCGVFRQIAIVRHHHRQRLTEVANLIDSQRIKLHRPQHRAAADAQRLDVLLDVLAGKHGVHAGHGARRFDIDRFDLGVSAGAARKRDLQCPWRQQVVDVATGAGNEALGFFAANPFADRRIDRIFHKSFLGCLARDGYFHLTL